MKIIAHRGLVNGPDKNKENTLPTIMSALGLGFDVEVDVWLQNNQLKLGHDKPGPTVPKWLFENKKICAPKLFDAHITSGNLKLLIFFKMLL